MPDAPLLDSLTDGNAAAVDRLFALSTQPEDGTCLSIFSDECDANALVCGACGDVYFKSYYDDGDTPSIATGVARAPEHPSTKPTR